MAIGGEMHKFSQRKDMNGYMNRTFAHDEIPRPVAIKSAHRRVFPCLDDAASRIEKPQEADVSKSVVLGRVVKSPKYGRGYVAKIEDNAVRVRFWMYGYKTFRVVEGGYPFELIDEVRPLKTPAPEESEDYCQHGENRHFCCKCAGLSDCEIEQWKPYRSNERRITRRVGSNQYIGVRVSGNDCVLMWRRQSNSKPIQNASSSEEVNQIMDLYFDPNSRFQGGGTGFLRIPLDDPRSTRADAPEWLRQRQDFFKTLKASRAARAERIFCEFYLGTKTDRQIAETLDWSKDSVKKERATLLRSGNRFFRICGGQIPP